MGPYKGSSWRLTWSIHTILFPLFAQVYFSIFYKSTFVNCITLIADNSPTLPRHLHMYQINCRSVFRNWWARHPARVIKERNNLKRMESEKAFRLNACSQRQNLSSSHELASFSSDTFISTSHWSLAWSRARRRNNCFQAMYCPCVSAHAQRELTRAWPIHSCAWKLEYIKQ